jgi:GNAT superfamily N-acetyltransferase
VKIRKAVAGDLEAIDRVMRESMRALGRGFYDERQLASAVAYIADPDHQLVADDTYFVVEDEDGQIVACGGWSARKKLFTGTTAQAAAGGMLDPAVDPARIRAMFVLPAHARRGLGRMILGAAERDARQAGFTRLELMATLPGVPLYEACGYAAVERSEIELPDGVRMGVVRMVK